MRASKKQDVLARLRQRHKPGDIIPGIFLRLEGSAPGLAWVNLEGADLLAVLPPELAEPARLLIRGRGVGAIPTGVREDDFPLQAGDDCLFMLETASKTPCLRLLPPDALEEAAAKPAEKPAPATDPAQGYNRARRLLNTAIRPDFTHKV